MARRPGQLNLFTGRTRAPPAPKEFELHVMVADTLRRWLSPDWKFTHIPNGELRSPSTGARLKRMGVIPGWPDFVLLSGDTGIAHFLELKRRGMGLSDEQADFADFCSHHGLPYAICDTFDSALTQLLTWGAVLDKVRISA